MGNILQIEARAEAKETTVIDTATDKHAAADDLHKANASSAQLLGKTKASKEGKGKGET
jgi:hypothetical protein